MCIPEPTHHWSVDACHEFALSWKAVTLCEVWAVSPSAEVVLQLAPLVAVLDPQLDLLVLDLRLRLHLLLCHEGGCLSFLVDLPTLESFRLSRSPFHFLCCWWSHRLRRLRDLNLLHLNQNLLRPTPHPTRNPLLESKRNHRGHRHFWLQFSGLVGFVGRRCD